jgi:hypothetical protein
MVLIFIFLNIEERETFTLIAKDSYFKTNIKIYDFIFPLIKVLYRIRKNKSSD